MAFGFEIYPIALEILTEAAVRGYIDGESALAICQGYEILASDPNKILREILEVLQHDGYLAQEADRFVFISHLLKDWWKARFAFGYTPVVERRA